MRYAVQKSNKSGYIPQVIQTKPEIRYYEAASIKDARDMHIKEHGFDWKYTTICPVFETGDYIGDYNDVCYLIKNISDESITIYNEITSQEYTEYVDYNKWHLLRKNNHTDITTHPIGSHWVYTKTCIFTNSKNNKIITAKKQRFFIC